MRKQALGVRQKSDILELASGSRCQHQFGPIMGLVAISRACFLQQTADAEPGYIGMFGETSSSDRQALFLYCPLAVDRL